MPDDHRAKYSLTEDEAGRLCEQLESAAAHRREQPARRPTSAYWIPGILALAALAVGGAVARISLQGGGAVARPTTTPSSVEPGSRKQDGARFEFPSGHGPFANGKSVTLAQAVREAGFRIYRPDDPPLASDETVARGVH
jgi:hypothetical protein